MLQAAYPFPGALLFVSKAIQPLLQTVLQRTICQILIHVDKSVELQEICLRGEYFEEELVGGLMEVIEVLGREVGFDEDSHEEVLGHFLTFGVGLLEVID